VVALSQLSNRLAGQPAAVSKIGPRSAAQFALLLMRADPPLMRLTLSLTEAEHFQPQFLTRPAAL